MTFPITVDADTPVTVTAWAALKHRCPFKDETDTGTVTIVWTCAGSTFELHSLAEYLGSFTDQVISHEDLVALIADDLRTVGPSIRIGSVTARFTTAGIDVEVSRGAVPVDTVGA